MTDAAAAAYQVPRDLPFLAILGILGTSVGGRRRVRVAPDWTEVLAIYTASLLPSGERKSPPFAAVSAPLRCVERDLVDRIRPDHDRQAAKRAAADAAVEKIKRRGDLSDDAMADLEFAVQRAAAIDVPPIPHLITDDSTPETMARIMGEQGGRLGVLSTEAGLFSILAGRYSNGIPNLDLVLKAWSGDYCRVDRISRETVIIEEPVLSVGLSFQPDILRSLAESQHFRGAGLLARWLWAMPASMVGRRSTQPTQVPDSVATAYGDTVETLAWSVRSSDETVEMTLTAAARDALDDMREDLEVRLDPEYGDLADIADWANKLPGQLIRIAALFTLAADPTATVIDERQMREALQLGDYFIDHAARVFDVIMGRRSPQEPARAVLRWIKRKRLTEFSARDAWQGLRGQAWAAKADDVHDAIADLQDRGWLCMKPTPPHTGPGRPPSPRFEAHPNLHVRRQARDALSEVSDVTETAERAPTPRGGVPAGHVPCVGCGAKKTKQRDRDGQPMCQSCQARGDTP